MQTAKIHRENWSEHQTTMFSSLHEKQKVGKYCDVILKCDDSVQTFNAHSCVLSSASHVFDKLLQDAMEERSLNESSDDVSFPKLVVKLPADVASSCVESLLNFIYSGNVDLGIKNENAQSNKVQDKPDATPRKTRRNSATTRNKPTDEVKEGPRIEISSLYIFLKAARCLDIKTLTEHLESAATLAKMKTGTSSDIPDRPPKRASAIKFQNTLRSTLVNELEWDSSDSSKPSKGRKRKQVAAYQTVKIQKEKTIKKKVVNTRKPVEVEKQIEKDESSTSLQENIADEERKSAPSPTKNEDSPILDENNGEMLQSATAEPESLPDGDQITKPLPISNTQEVIQFEKDSETDVETKPRSQRRKSKRPSHLWDKSSDETGEEVKYEPDSVTAEEDSCQDEWNPIKISKDEEGKDQIRKTRSSIFRSKRRKRKNNWNDNANEDQSIFTCHVCGKECTSSRNLNNHFRSHERPDIGCTFCHQTFKYKTALKRHLLWHTGDGQDCQICGKSVFSQREMTLHMSTHNEKKMRTQCNLCQKWFTSAYVMQLHMRTHTGTELFTCHICRKKFPYKSSLKMHMMLHTGERPYMCSVCGKSFTQKIHAKEHEHQHAGYKRFQCQYCDRYFAHKCGLTRHVSDIHHRSRPFVCETCGKSFPRKTKLIEHTRIHTGEKPYVCDVCGVCYKANRSLKCHKKNRHNIYVPDYEIGIWRKGPLPAQSTPAHSKGHTFHFPVDSINEMESMVQSEKEEDVINNTGIAKEVDVIATGHTSSDASPTSVTSRDDPVSHFDYPLPRTDTTNLDSYRLGVTVSSNSEAALPTLPTAEALSQTTQGIVLPSLSSISQSTNKTFIVPLNANAASNFPVMCNQPSMVGTSNHLPGGMMLTYMMPAQQDPIEISESIQSTTESASTLPIQMSRSASVPPMSTFRRHIGPVMQVPTVTGAIFPQATSAVSLPGMHTFQPVQLPMAVSQIPPQFLTRFTTMHPGVPVLVPASPVMPTTQSVNGAVESSQTTQIIQQSAEWQAQFASNGTS